MAQQAITYIGNPSKNREVSIRFYKELFGWGRKDAPDRLGYNTLISDKIRGFPGLRAAHKLRDIIIYIDSDDLDTDLERIKKLGGKVYVPKTELPGIGCYSIFFDPAGNRVALWMEYNSREPLPLEADNQHFSLIIY